ncbi:hypothetical protein GpartN1_g7118.t1 [Galdieria partita]|uniref:Major facilitator superfamily (MFS) profile domain-containing protein n=1 Tax=Galdieria partita TaxID=83374 RepID=A0A9C7Q5G3_9RHOD|nr:hypothetical protein GpartN1_g7118.t1 [Galdieria partita]
MWRQYFVFWIEKTLETIRLLNQSPRELWLIYVIKFLSSFSYFSYSLILTLYLSSEFDFSDERAGWTFGAYGFMSVLYGMSLGWIVDYLGVRYALLLGAVLGTFSRWLLAFSSSSRLVVFFLYTFLPFSESLGIPVMTIGIKRYSNSNNRTIAYSMFYTFMNIAALVAGPVVDMSRRWFGKGLVIWGHSFDSLQLIILCGSVSTFFIVLIVLWGMRDIQYTESGDICSYRSHSTPLGIQLKEVFMDSTFWRLALFMFLLVGVRLVFRHMDATLPKYMIRELGEDAPFGAFYAINPFLVIILVPLIGMLSKGMDSFPMILYGSFLSGGSVFILCIGPYYICIASFLIVLSIGEAIYSPRVYEYTMQVSGEGREGLYTSLASIPLFGVVLVAGGMSGYLLQHFCSIEKTTRHCSMMWALIGLFSFSSPCLLYLFRNVIQGVTTSLDVSHTTTVEEDTLINS